VKIKTLRDHSPTKQGEFRSLWALPASSRDHLRHRSHMSCGSGVVPLCCSVAGAGETLSYRFQDS